MPDLLDMSSQGEPDTDQVGGWQDNAAKVHERLDMLVKERIIGRIRLVVVATLAGCPILEQLCFRAGCAPKLKLARREAQDVEVELAG